MPPQVYQEKACRHPHGYPTTRGYLVPAKGRLVPAKGYLGPARILTQQKGSLAQPQLIVAAGEQ
ncbi:uncharacterized protein N7487_000714 [Penicillium crustosum]|uniref:uncharacterized protein n=1 Tax=Penicillium crustosum TaxID=36656 RepID=UPI00239D468C|nr:uncharacterized protein N7487_000714 [Penicillium crustosum]KAJ5417164.1 hypothetical protein N7487_000714 [Penicillium crustosum]